MRHEFSTFLMIFWSNMISYQAFFLRFYSIFHGCTSVLESRSAWRDIVRFPVVRIFDNNQNGASCAHYIVRVRNKKWSPICHALKVSTTWTTWFVRAQIIFSEAMLREAFRVTLAVTKVDSLLRATSDSESLFCLKSNMGAREMTRKAFLPE